MQQRVLGMLNQIKNRWVALSNPTKTKLIMAIVVFALAIAATIYITTKPEMVVIDNSMDPARLGEAVSLLNDNGIKAQVTSNTTALSVPKQSVDNARLLLAMNNLTTKDFTYEDALSNQKMGTTAKTSSYMQVLAKQTAIKQSLETLTNVKKAEVLLSIPEVTPFILRDQDLPSAAIVLDTVGEMPRAQAESIAVHVSKSVQNLKLDNISVTDTNGRSLFQTGPDSTAGLSAKQEVETAKKYELENQVRELLAAQYDIVDVMARLDWNWTGQNVSEITYTPFNADTGAGMKSKEVLSNSEATNQEVQSEPGTMANNGTTPQYPSGNGGQSSGTLTTSDTDYLYNERRTNVTDSPLGKVNLADSSLAVAVYVNRVYDEAYLKANDGLVNAAGETVSWADFQTNMKLSQVAIPANVITPLVARVSKATGIPEEDIDIQGFERPIFVDAVIPQRPINQLLMAALLLLIIGLLAFGLIRRTTPVEITEVEPELSVEELLVSSTPEDELTVGGAGAAEENIAEIDYLADSELKKQVDRFIDDRPEAAAQLLRNWLAEEWE